MICLKDIKDKLSRAWKLKRRKDDSKLTYISKANFTKVYLMAGPIKQKTQHLQDAS